MKTLVLMFGLSLSVNGAAFFDGANAWFLGPTSGNILNSTQQVAMTAEFVTYGAVGQFVEKGDARSLSTPSLYTMREAIDWGYWSVANSALYNYRVTSAIQSGIPYFQSLSFSYAVGSSTMNVWQSGTNLVGTWNSSTPTGQLPDLPNNNPLRFGARLGSTLFWKGTFSDAACWNATLTSGQLKMLGASHLKRLPQQILPGNLVWYYMFDSQPQGGSYVTEKDRSGNGNHLTGQGTPLPIGSSERSLSYPPNE